MKTERELFEKEFTSSSLFVLDFGCSDRAFRKNVDGTYYYTSVQGSWEMWQASASREGYKLVPVEPEFETMRNMSQALRDNTGETPKRKMQEVYKAMIGAVE